MYTDNCTYPIAINPLPFNAIVADNLFGDLLADLVGTLVLPSASLSDLPKAVDGVRRAVMLA